MVDSVWIWLNTAPTGKGVLDPFGGLFIVVFGCGFLISAYLAGTGADQGTENPVLRHGIRHWATVGLWIFGPGLVFFAMRTLQINPLSFGEPIWLVASVIALIVAGVR